MLSKEICKRCIEESEYAIWGKYNWCVTPESPSLSDEEHWEQGVVWCGGLGKAIKIAEDPPIECPYLLEQLVQDVE